MLRRRTVSLCSLATAATVLVACSDAGTARPSLEEASIAGPGVELVVDGVRGVQLDASAASAAGAAEGGEPTEAGAEPQPDVDAPVEIFGLTAGSRHTCVVDAAGELSCWGVGGSGGLMGVPWPVAAPVSAVVDAAAGDGGTCAALVPDGQVTCWGRRYVNGAVGMIWEPPSLVEGVAGIVQMEGHEAFFCGRTVGGEVWCWEREDPAATREIPAPPMSDMTAGYGHGCGLDEAGRAWCWGLAQWGGFGPGWDFEYDLGPQGPQVVNSLVGLVDISAGRFHTCAVHDSGEVWCWGWDVNGQLGRGFDGGTESGWEFEGTLALPAEPVPGITDAVSVHAGDQNTCVVRATGELLCWGSNGQGQLGRGTTGPADGTPRGVPGLGPVVSVAVGHAHICAQRVSGEVACWGGNGGGQLGVGVVGDKAVPSSQVLAPALEGLSVGGHHGCGVAADGVAWCWGDNGSGRLGDGAEGRRRYPVEVQGVGAAWRQVSAGYFNTCGVTDEGEVWCWGRNTLDLAGPEPLLEPVRVSGLEDVVQVGAGVVHTCARTGDGRVWCFGGNDDHQLGDGTTVDDPTPKPVPNVVGATWLEVGSELTCAGDDAGKAWCWGTGPAVTGESVAWPHPTLWPEPVQRMVVSNSATCVVAVDGALSCYGWNGLCQVGPGASELFGGGAVSLDAPVLDLALGAHHGCVLHPDGSTTCWGSKHGGVLGTGEDSGKACSPVAGPVLPGATALAAGNDHTCARVSAGAVTCWGRGGQGQLGDGDAWVPHPTSVVGL